MFGDTIIYQISMGLVLFHLNNNHQCWIVPRVDGYDIFQNCVEDDGDESNTVLYAFFLSQCGRLMGFQWGHGPFMKIVSF